MICPKCGSENVQFSTKTSGGGYSAGKGFCGWLLLGPLGFLCGACGSKTTTEEFWICHKCGHKFSADAAQKAAMQQVNAEKQIAQTCEKYKQDLGNQSTAYYINQHDRAKHDKVIAEADYERTFKALIDRYAPENKTVRKYKKKYCKESRPGCLVLIILVILGIISCIVGLPPIGIPLILVGMTLGIISIIREHVFKKKVEKILIEEVPSFKKCIDHLKKSKESADYWEGYADKAKYVERNDKNNNKTNPS